MIPPEHVMTSSSFPDEVESEMKQWEERGVSRNIVEPLKIDKAAECFAAFLVNYECGHRETYIRLKETMTEVFMNKLVHGESFVDADEDDKKIILGVLMTALLGVVDENALTKTRVKKFMRKAKH